MQYSIGFRKGVLRKVLPPSNRSILSVSREHGIADQTIRNWLKKLKADKFAESSQELSTTKRNNLEKLHLLLQSKSLNGEALGKWMRERGVHTETLKLWEQELREVMTDREKRYKEELREIKKKNKELEKELRRKEKALAETAALLTLKKKADALWGDRGEE